MLAVAVSMPEPPVSARSASMEGPVLLVQEEGVTLLTTGSVVSMLIVCVGLMPLLPIE